MDDNETKGNIGRRDWTRQPVDHPATEYRQMLFGACDTIDRLIASVQELEREVAELKRATAVECTCRAIEKCDRCTAIDKRSEPPPRRHYCGSSERLTACGRQRNKLGRGYTAFEWNYVTCPACLATRST